MKKLITSAGLVALAAAAFVPSIAAAEEAKPDWTFTGNAGLFSDYRFRGFTQTAYRPAFQGGFDLAHSSGFYVGNWNSNVEQALYRGASLEMDFYGGYKFGLGDVGLDVGAYYYAYPSKNTGGQGQVKQEEIYFGAGYGPVSAKLWYGVSNFFGLGDGTATDTKGNYYLDLNGNFDLGEGFALVAHYGYQHIKNGTTLGLAKNNVGDYKLGVTKDLSGWSVGGAVVGTSKKDLFTTGVSAPEAGGKTSVVLSLSKSF